MKHWDALTSAERQDRLGDPTIDRSSQRDEMEVECLRRVLRGEKFTKWQRQMANRALATATVVPLADGSHANGPLRQSE